MANAIIVRAEAACREAMTKFNDPYFEVPAELTKWGYEYYGGDGPLVHARAYPDQWHEAFLLTIFEAIALAFGVRLAPEERPWAVRYDSANGKYLAYPLRKLSKRHELMMEPHPWHHLYAPMLRASVRPLKTAALRIGDWIAIASDMASQAVDGLWQTIHVYRRVAS